MFACYWVFKCGRRPECYSVYFSSGMTSSTVSCTLEDVYYVRLNRNLVFIVVLFFSAWESTDLCMQLRNERIKYQKPDSWKRFATVVNQDAAIIL